MSKMIEYMERLSKDGAFGSIYFGEVRHTQVAVKLITEVYCPRFKLHPCG